MPFISFLPHIGITVFDYDMSGGLTCGGTAAESITKTYPVSNGVITSGTAPESLTKTYAPSGGLTTGGTALILRVAVYVPSDGIQTGGAGSFVCVHVYPVSGGLTTSGTAPESITKTYTVSNGITTSGAASESLTKVYTVSGGLTSGGTAPIIHVEAYTPSQGVHTGGSGSVVCIHVYTVSGGLLTGGVDPTSFVTEYVYASSGAVLTGGVASTELSQPSRGAGLIARSQLYQLIHDAYNPPKPPKKIFTYTSRGGGAQIRGSSTTDVSTTHVQRHVVYDYVPVRAGCRLLRFSASCELIPAIFTPSRTIYLVQGRGTIRFSGGTETAGFPVTIDGYPDIVKPFLMYSDPYTCPHGVRVYGEAVHGYTDRIQQIIEQEDEELLLGLLT